MLRELLRARYACPLCGRILYPPLKGYWCPFCGTSLKDESKIDTITLTNRITARDEYGIPYYCGRYTMRRRAYAQDIELSAIAEILEKLCQYEELDEEKEEDNGD